MNIYEYRVILVNAIYYEASKTEEGRKLLDDYYRYSQHNTEFDTNGILSIV